MVGRTLRVKKHVYVLCVFARIAFDEMISVKLI